MLKEQNICPDAAEFRSQNWRELTVSVKYLFPSLRRDLTHQNILKMSPGEISIVKITDFGLSRLLKRKTTPTEVSDVPSTSFSVEDTEPVDNCLLLPEEPVATANFGAMKYNAPESIWLRLKVR